MKQYALGMSPRNPAHYARQGESLTLCGLRLDMLSEIHESDAPLYRPCEVCAGVASILHRWRMRERV